MKIYVAYNHYGDMICDGRSYEECEIFAELNGYAINQFFIMVVSA